MNDLQFGSVVRAIRHRRRWTQRELGDAAGASDSQVSRIERGQIDGVPVSTIRRIASVLEIRVELIARWRGGELDRLVNAAHSALHEGVARWFARTHTDWIVAPEVSFGFGGERGVIDELAYHPTSRTVLVVELKTQIVDVNELLGTLDRKRRLARRIAAEHGWPADNVGCLLIVAGSRTNERRLAAHATVLRAALPADGRAVRRWLRIPAGPCAGILIWREPLPTRAGTRRIRRTLAGAEQRSREPDMPTKAGGTAVAGGRGAAPD